METWLIYGGLAVFGGIFGGAVAGALVCWLRLSLIERQYMTVLSSKGVGARQDKAQRLEEALFKAAALYKEGKTPKDALLAVSAEYPDVAMRLAEKGIGKLIQG